jgi:hypothetical protein
MKYRFIQRGVALLIGVCCSMQVLSAPVGQFAAHVDVGPVKHAGAVHYDEKLQHYRVTGSGKNMWFGQDELHYVYNEVQGDFIVRANVAFEGVGVEPHRKIGWNLRSSLDPGSPQVLAMVHGDGTAALQFRAEPGGNTAEYTLSVQSPDVLQLERRGDVYIMSAAKMGQPFQVTSVSHVKLGDKILVGLSVCAHNPDVSETAVFSNVRLITPAAKNFRPYRDYIGSHLEILDLKTKNSRIVYSTPDAIEAPNWTPDGKTLIYNSKGRLFNFDLASGKPSVLDTGFAIHNNNDHVLSWSGRMLGISHHVAEEGQMSALYVLPVGGSPKPVRVTAAGVGHSYLHGFSRDDKELLFTGQRDGRYNLFSINLETGRERRLTDTTALDDGSESSPDGKFIYFHSNRTGTMQLWRMAPDGSDPKQLTFDTYNNWFPHVSPDGKKIAFLSYMSDVDPGDHPYYRQVYLREMPADGGEAQIVAYVYGGQGTINVPSWSPDSAQIAFVSNSKQ